MSSPFRTGRVVTLEPYDKRFAEEFSEWYYDYDYRFFFRDFSHIMGNEDFEKLGDKMTAHGSVLLIIVDVKTQTPIGVMTYQLEKPNARIFKFGIMLDREHQGKTFAIESIIVLGDFLFIKRQAHKLVVEFCDEDQQIHRITQKGGFTHDGTFAEELFVDGKYYAETRYSISRAVYDQLYAAYLDGAERERMATKSE